MFEELVSPEMTAQCRQLTALTNGVSPTTFLALGSAPALSKALDTSWDTLHEFVKQMN